MIQELKKRFGIESELIRTYHHPYVYLNREEIAKHDLDAGEVESAVARELMSVDGIAYAVPSSALLHGDVPDRRIVRAVLANFHPARSGDIFVVFEPQVFINDFDGLEVATNPWFSVPSVPTSLRHFAP